MAGLGEVELLWSFELALALAIRSLSSRSLMGLVLVVALLPAFRQVRVLVPLRSAALGFGPVEVGSHG